MHDDLRDLFERPDFLRPDDTLPPPVARHPSGICGDARWASARDIERFLGCGAERGALLLPAASPVVEEPGAPKGARTLLRAGLRWTAVDRFRHILCVGKTGSHKTTCVFLPMVSGAVRRPGESAILAVTKPEVAAALLEDARRAGKPALLLRPGFPDQSASINPCAGPMTESRALEIAQRLLHSARGRTPGGDWVEAFAIPVVAEMFLRLAEREGGTSLGRVAERVKLPRDRLIAWCREAPGFANLDRFARDLENRNVNTETVMSDIAGVFATMDEGNRLIFDGDEIDPARIGREPMALACLMDEHRIDAYRPLWSLVFHEIFSRLIEVAGASEGGRLPVQVLAAFDEFSAIGPIAGFATLAHGFRSRGISVLANIQSICQLEPNYPRDVRSVLAAFGTKIFLSPLDPADSAYASEELGVMTASKETIRRTRDPETGRFVELERTVEPVPRRLALPQELARPPSHPLLGSLATILLPDAPPIRAFLRPAYEQAEFSHLFEPRAVPERATPLRRRPASEPLLAADTVLTNLRDRLLRWHAATPEAKLWFERLVADMAGAQGELLGFLNGLAARGATVQAGFERAMKERSRWLRRILESFDPRPGAGAAPDPLDTPRR